MSINLAKVTALPGLAVGGTNILNGLFYTDGSQASPVAVSFTAIDPLGVPTVYLWPPDGVVINTEVGLFTMELPLPTSGRWRVILTGTGWPLASTSFDVAAALETVNVTVETNAMVPVLLPGATVEFRSTDGVLRASAISGVTGVAVLLVRPGTYQVSISSTGTIFSEALSFVVTNTNGVTPHPVTYQGTFLNVTLVSPEVKRVLVYGYVDQSEGVAGSRVVVEEMSYGAQRAFVAPISGGSGISAQKVMATAFKREAVLDQNGFWSTFVVSNTLVRVSVPSTKFMVIFRVPSDVDSINIRDARPDPGPGGGVGVWSDSDPNSHTGSLG